MSGQRARQEGQGQMSDWSSGAEVRLVPCRFAMGALVANEVSNSGTPREPACAKPTGGLVSFSCGLLIILLLRPSFQPLYFGKFLP